MVDLPVFGRPTRLVWRNQWWPCQASRRRWVEQQPEIASARCALTTRAAPWATPQVGLHGRSGTEVADDPGSDWNTVMEPVDLYGTLLIDDPDRFDTLTDLGLDETLSAGRAGSGSSGDRPRSSTSAAASSPRL